jgi:RNA polymerase sigma factor (sigma-70 family)
VPGWPTVDRAGDQRLVDALRRADADAPTRLYDAYGERLYDYAHWLLREEHGAADAVHDALVTAHGCVARLRDEARLRAWLYALTRVQARARLTHRNGVPSRGPASPAASPGPDTLPWDAVGGDHDREDDELAALVSEALGELGGIGREVLGLSLRHGLTPAEAGAVLGLTSRQAAGRLTRARNRLENAAAAVVLARVGRAHCPDLSAMLDSWVGPLTPTLRRRLAAHIGGCEVCTEGRHREVAAVRLLEMTPMAYPPLSLRRRVADTCLRPDRADNRNLIMELGEGFDRAGFPVVAGRPRRRRRPRGLVPVAVAGVCVLAATGAMVVVGDDGVPAALRVAPTASVLAGDPGLTPEPEPEAGTGPEPTASASEPPASASERTRPSSTPSATASVGHPATRQATGPSPTRRARPAARLAASCPAGVDGAGDTARVALRARNATVSWKASAGRGLEVFPESGSLRPGGSTTVWVSVADPDRPGSGTVSFSSNGGAAKCPLSWPGRSPDAEPPPDDQTATPDATDSPTALPETASENTRRDTPQDAQRTAGQDSVAEPARTP